MHRLDGVSEVISGNEPCLFGGKLTPRKLQPQLVSDWGKLTLTAVSFSFPGTVDRVFVIPSIAAAKPIQYKEGYLVVAIPSRISIELIVLPYPNQSVG